MIDGKEIELHATDGAPFRVVAWAPDTQFAEEARKEGYSVVWRDPPAMRLLAEGPGPFRFPVPQAEA